jgi:hypothetical protein
MAKQIKDTVEEITTDTVEEITTETVKIIATGKVKLMPEGTIYTESRDVAKILISIGAAELLKTT